MRILIGCGIAFSMLIGAAADAVVAFVDVSVIPMTRERVLEHQTVLVEEERITALGPASEVAVPEGAERVDGAGRFLIPAFSDMHVHFNGGRRENPKYLKLYVANGVTTVFSMNGHESVLALRTAVASGEIIGPTIYTTGPVIGRFTNPGGYDGGAREVREQAAAGYDAIKVYNDVNAEAYEGIMDAAADVGIPVVGHAVRAVGIEGALRRGQHVVHMEEFIYGYFHDGLDALRIPKLVADVKASGIYVTNTLVAYHTILEQLTDLDKALAAPGVEYIEPRTRSFWAAEKNNYRKRFDQEELDNRLAPAYAFLEVLTKAFQEADIPMLTGTDATMPVVVPGYSLFRELEYMAAAGLTPYEALLAATRCPAEHLGIADETGTIEPGKRADLILLESNPLIDISHVRHQAGVLHRGRWRDKAAIQTMLDELKP